MVNKNDITTILSEIDSRYNESRGVRDPLYYSKLALIELCGWIEVTMDSIVLDCAKKHLRNADNINYVEKRVIRRTYSFLYEDHFRPMLMRVIGLVKVEELEGMLDPTKFEVMKSSLGTLKTQRDSAAHRYIDGTTTNMDAPSVINRHFQNVSAGLIDIGRCIQRLSI